MLKKQFLKKTLEAGCDEAGRGCLAGPVFAAAVILPANYKNPILNDSKQLSEKQRYLLRDDIIKKATTYGIGIVNHAEIDEINILNASILAMHRAIDKLTIRPEHLIIDGNRFKAYLDIPHTCIIKGDSKFYAIAAASVLAKTFRDDYMQKIAREFPVYQWQQNKGYPTKKHRAAIAEFGTSSYHRLTFKLLANDKKS